jgi:hypothetical protein
MKKVMRLFVFLFTVCFLSLSFSSLYADSPDPPPVPDHGKNGSDPVGAPIDGGACILLLMGSGYAAWKLYSIKKEKAEVVSR